MSKKERSFTPLQLAGAALFFARADDEENTFEKWTVIRSRFTEIRGRIDPVLDQSANIDLLLRSFEDEFASRGGDVSSETAALNLHIQLSRMWVISVYECLRQLHKDITRTPNEFYTCQQESNSKGCGRHDCVACSIGHLRNEFALVRMPIAKKDVAGDISKPPLTPEGRDEILSEQAVLKPPKDKFLLENEGRMLGVVGWYIQDGRVENKYRIITRRKLSDRLLAW